VKRVLIALLSILVLGVTPVHAETPPTLVLIDAGVNTSLFPNIVYEVCTVENGLCPNGKNFMEGTGASNLPQTTNASLNHGNQMLSIITKISPNAKVIPIRIIGITNTGVPYLYSLASVKSALDWVVANRVKFNISVVSLSQGKIFADCKMPDGMATDLAVLKANNVQVVASTGNDSNRTAMFSPACSPDVISVGATDNPAVKAGVTWNKTATPYIARYSNGTAQTTLYANARWFVTNLDGSTKFMVGTSNATASVAGWVFLNKGTDWNATYTNLITAAKGTASNEWLKGRYLFIDN
jgi:hypothetical protein